MTQNYGQVLLGMEATTTGNFCAISMYAMFSL